MKSLKEILYTSEHFYLHDKIVAKIIILYQTTVTTSND